MRSRVIAQTEMTPSRIAISYVNVDVYTNSLMDVGSEGETRTNSNTASSETISGLSQVARSVGQR